MSSLYVYTTEGTCIYPEGGSDDASINRYFESVNFVADLQNPNNPSIEAYFRAVLPSGRPEQLFLRFQGDDPSSLFEDCRRAVQDELVSANGWEIQRTDDSGDPSMVFQRAVLNPAADPDRVFENTPLAGRREVLLSAIHGTQSQFTMAGRNYHAIADAIRALDDESVVMAVADGDISLSGVDVSFSRERQQYDLALPRDSEQVLQQVAQRDRVEREQMATPEPERIESELSTIEVQLRSIQDKDVSQSTVRKQLDSVVSDVYPSLSVSSGSQSPLVGRSRSTSDDESADEGSDDGGPIPSPATEGRFSGLLPNVPDRVAIGAVVGVVLVTLLGAAVVFGGVGFGDDGGGGDGEADFEVEFLNEDNSVTAGDELEIRVEVENVGVDPGGETITVDAESLGTEQLTFESVGINDTRVVTTTFETAGQSGEYTVTAENYTASTNVEVLDPANFEVTITDIDEEEVDEEEQVDVEYEVENTGGVEDTQDLRFVVDDETVDTEDDVTVAGDDETHEGSFSYETESGDAPDITVTVESEDDLASETVTVRELPFFAVEITSTHYNEEKVEVGYEVTNEGGIDDTQDIILKVNGEETREEDVTVGGEAKEGILRIEPEDDPPYEVTIESEDDDDGQSGVE